MKENEKKRIWQLITKKGDDLKGKLKKDLRHPNGRNSYAHICGLIISKYGCSYKDIESNRVVELEKFISEINEQGRSILKGGNIMLLIFPIQFFDKSQNISVIRKNRAKKFSYIH